MIINQDEWELSSTISMYDREYIWHSYRKKKKSKVNIQQNTIYHVDQNQKHTD